MKTSFGNALDDSISGSSINSLMEISWDWVIGRADGNHIENPLKLSSKGVAHFPGTDKRLVYIYTPYS